MPAVPPVTPNLGLPRFAADSSANIWAHLNAISDVLDAIAGPWTSYTPAWAQSNGTVLHVGSGSLTGRYWAFGKTVLVQIRLQRAADSNVGSGAWVFTLPPVTPRAWNMLSGGFAMVRNGDHYGGAVFPASATGVGAIAGDLGRVSHNIPVATHADGDWYSLQMVLERA